MKLEIKANFDRLEKSSTVRELASYKMQRSIGPVSARAKSDGHPNPITVVAR